MKVNTNICLTNMVDAAGSSRFTYTDFGALLSEDGPWDSDTITYAYTTNRLRNKLTLLQPNASDWIESYAYDAANRLTNVTSPAGVFGYSYDSMCHLLVSKLTQPPGSFITNTYDGLGRVTGTYLKNSQLSTLNSHQYIYDDGSRRTRQTRTGGEYVDYGYDNIGQLKTAIGKESGGTTNRMHEQLGYAYDAAGNLTNRTNNALTQAFNVDNQNELTSVTRSGKQTVSGTTWGLATNVTVADNGNSAVAALRYADATFARTNVTLLDGTNTFTAVAQDNLGRADTNTTTAYLPATVTFAYDSNGNMTTNGTRVFEYDDENQLIRITEPNVWKSEFTYDGKMRRRIRKEYDWSSGSWVLKSEIRYVYDGKLVIQERDSFNLPQVTYTRGRDLSGSLEGAGGIGGLLARTDNSKLAIGDIGAHAYYHADGNGNITSLFGTNQLIVARYVFDPFGRTLAAVGSLADANLYRFSSKESHPNSGCVYYLYRLYEPSAQRWVNRDPLRFSEIAESPNLYSFAANRPTDRIDVDGKQLGPLQIQWFALQGAIGAAAGFLHGILVNRACRCLAPGEELFISTPATRLLTLIGAGLIVLQCPDGGVVQSNVWRDDVTGECHNEYVVRCFGGGPGA